MRKLDVALSEHYDNQAAQDNNQAAQDIQTVEPMPNINPPW